MKLAALIPSAGFSSRIEGFKPLLRIGTKRIVEHVIELFQSVGVDRIIIVVGHRAEELIPVIEAAGAQYVVNANYSQGMFSSIQRGAKEVRDSCDAFFLLPVDIPLVRPETIERVKLAFSATSRPLICYPQFQARRGHPPLVDVSLIESLLTYHGQGGMRGFLKSYNDLATEVPVDDPFIRRDADTLEDLSFLRENFARV